MFANTLHTIAEAIPTPARPSSRAGARPASRARSRAEQRESLISSTLKRRSSHSSRPSSEADSGPFSQREKVYRWDGIIGARGEWDCVRRDHELWTPEGDALVHFYARGQSRRGPSIRLNFRDIQQSNCGPMLQEALVLGDSAWELYLPAPRGMERYGAFRYHLTTRNVFAWMFDRPLVGSQLGPALISLHERLDKARPDAKQNARDMLEYIESQGYSDFRDNPDHAAAMLVYAERYQVAQLWTDAFVHAAGLHEQLPDTLDWPSVSATTKALLARATCEMRVRLERAAEEVSSFMEDSLARLGLPDDATRHLERFRSFLHSHYVQTVGYWPPELSNADGSEDSYSCLPKALMRSMYAEFRSLYDLLADTEPAAAESDDNSITTSGNTSLSSSSSSSTGKLDVAALVRAFDRRHRFAPLPHATPLIPSHIPAEPESLLTYILPAWGAGKRTRTGRRAAVVNALVVATNAPADPMAAGSPLVRAYRDFEREVTLAGEERIAAGAARGARWLLVYAVLQTLADATRAPREVRDSDGVAYPLCVQTAGTPPWTTAGSTRAAVAAAAELEAPAAKQELEDASSAVVAPLNLAAVASRRQSAVLMPGAFDEESEPATPLLVAPKPRRPADLATGVLAQYNRGSVVYDGDDAEEDVPELSPTSDRRSHHSRSSSDGSSETAEARTPTSALDEEERRGVVSYFDEDNAVKTHTPPPSAPSPSIYEEAVEQRQGSDFDLLRSLRLGGKGHANSEELAARWRGEIGVESP